MNARPLRPHQVEGLDRLRRSLGQGKLAPLFGAPTGFGKTRVMAEIVRLALAKGRRALIVVPAIELIDQTVAALEAEQILDLGVMQGLHERTDGTAPVQIASVQTLQRRKMPPADLILVDEAHRWFKFFERMIADAKTAGVPVIGLSATPWAKGLGKHYDELIQVVTAAELIEQGFLSPFRVYAPSHPDLDDVRTVAGDYHEGDLAEVMGKPELVADVVATWLRLADRRPTLCFAVDRAHAKRLQTEFEAACIRTDYVDAYTPKDERRAIRDRFQSGEIEVVCNVGCLTTGVDWDVRCIILARPTKSEMLFVQVIGRGLRTAPGKDHCLVLDHSDTHLNLGMVTDICHDELDDGKGKQTKVRRVTVPKPKECPSCHFLRPAKVHKCPACGFAPAAQVSVETVEGDLVQFDRKGAKISLERKVSIYGQLQWIGRHHGYNRGWAAHKFKEFFGVWPNAVSWAPIIEPTPEIVSWVKSRQIAYAKRRTKADSAA